MVKKKSSLGNKKIVIIVLAVLVALVAGLAIYAAVRESSKTCTTYNGSAEKQCVEDYIGLPQDEANARAKQYKYIPVIVSVDGEQQDILTIGGPLVHLKITDGRVSDAYFEEE